MGMIIRNKLCLYLEPSLSDFLLAVDDYPTLAALKQMKTLSEIQATVTAQIHNARDYYANLMFSVLNRPQSDKESVKLLTVKTISNESGEHSAQGKSKN
ncbi:Hypothetical predicted protein [Marmota monax]|uniref:Uncharacterized protein n=1 Tax=Marmota monax TaxID=9995 RepID=A0A5E4CLX5_MARMO|nr:Hypothetical predicted protein [Marmota monax]